MASHLGWLAHARFFALASASLAFLGGVAAAPAARAAGTVLDSGGFEDYVLGNLAGQHDWIGIGGPGGRAVVQADVAHSGFNSLQVDRAGDVDNRWAVPLSASLPTNRFVMVEWDMRVMGTGVDNVFGPYFGVECYDDVGLLGSFGVDASTSDVLYQIEDTGFLTETGRLVDFGEWNHFRAVFDFNLNQYYGYLNGTHYFTTGFVDRGASHTNLDQFTDADIAAIGGADDPMSQALIGTAFFDNFRVVDGVAGDFDASGDVAAADLTLWQAAFGNTAAGDADGDLDTDGDDFLTWQRNVGADLTPTAAAGAPAPEPGAASMIAAALAAAIARPRTRAAA
jgi:hypothetical protein